MDDDAIAYTATINANGLTTGHRIEVEVHLDGPGGPTPLVYCTGALMLDAYRLRRLAARCATTPPPR